MESRPLAAGALLDGRRVFAEKVDDRTMLVFFGLPDTILTTSFLSQTTYYFIAVVVLIAFSLPLRSGR